MGNINPKYVEEASDYKGKEKTSYRKNWYKWGVAAACFILLVLGGISILPLLSGPLSSQLKYKHQIMGAESAIEWPWEYKTMAEKYHTLRYDSREYGIKNVNPVWRLFFLQTGYFGFAKYHHKYRNQYNLNNDAGNGIRHCSGKESRKGKASAAKS